MSNLSHSESRRMYSWWWDSHNTPKNSRWLQDNLTDIDGKVKSMIKLIEEDADSFARRAEMYYKKRPELMKLVEEFYRAYRALAERYNHATGELRHAQQTIAKAFPDEVPFELVEDNSPSQERRGPWPHMTEIKHPVHAFLDADDLLEINAHGLSSSEGVPRGKGLKQLPEMFGAEKTGARNQNLEDKAVNETKRAKKPESEVQSLKKALADMKAEKDNVLVQYKQCLEKLSEIERDLSNAQMDSTRLSEKASRAEIEVHTLKETLVQFEVEKIAEMIKQNVFLEKISHLEAVASRFQEDVKGLDRKACKAETEAQNLRSEISRLEVEKETVVRKYRQCLEKILDLEKTISSNEDKAKLLNKQAEIVENEVCELKRAFGNLNKEKEDMALEYKYYLGKITELERDLSIAKNNVERLNNEVLTRNEKLKSAEKKCTLMETSNRLLRFEADNLAEKIASKDEELMKKQEELEKLQIYLKDEHSRHTQVESTLESLQNMHSRSQEDQKALAVELNNVVQILKEMEISKNGLEEEIQQVRDKNCSLSRTNLSSSVCMENMQNEIVSLKEIRERLENEVSHHIGVTISLQKEILCLKEEIDGLNRSYKALVEQVEAAGLDPTCVQNSIKSLHDENLKLKEKIEQESIEKVILYKKVEEIEEVLKKKVVVESSLSDLSAELAVSREEKTDLVVEKAFILSQLQAMTENMKNLLRKNAVLEDSFSVAKVELQGLREKSKGLEEICELLKKERSYLLSERGTLVLKLENADKRLNGLEKQFMVLEEKYADLEKDKKSMHCQVEKLKVSLSEEKQERKGSQIESETQLAGLENRIHLLHEENRSRKMESEEELDKSLKAQFEICVLQKFIKDMEDKNCSLIIECQKHVEASRLAEKLISELEGESLEQQLESELLLDEIERLRLSIYQIFKILETGSDCAHDDRKVENEQTLVNHILGSIEDLKCCVSKLEEEKRQLLVENSDLLALLEQLESKRMEIESKKVYLERESEIMAEKLFIVENEKDELVEINRHLKSDVNKGGQEAAVFQAELASLCVKQADLQEAYSRANEENTYLLKKFSQLKEEKFEVDRKNDAILGEFLATSNESAILRSFGREKVMELKSVLEDLNKQDDVSMSLEKEMNVLREKLELQKAGNLALKDSVCRLERELQEVRESNVKMNNEIINGKESLNHKEAKLLDTELKLEAAEELNSNLFRTVIELKNDIHELLNTRENLEKNISEFSKKNSSQQKEIESLHVVNKNLESELVFLHQEMEENTVREQTLSTELQEMNHEFELWETEASTFCFDLQVSSINEILLTNKVQELSGICETLEHKREEKISEIEKMKEKVCLMENEVTGLKSQLHAYAPAIASLRNDISTLEQNALLHIKLKAGHSQETELSEVVGYPIQDTFQILPEDPSLFSLQNLQMRVKALGKLIEETNKPVSQRRSNSDRIQEFSTVETVQLKPRRSLIPKNRYAKSPEVRNGRTLMKDIPLDQVSNKSSRRPAPKKGKVGSEDLMLELWETAEDENKDHTIDEYLEMSYKSMTERGKVLYDGHNNLKGESLLPLTDSDVEKELAVDKLELLSTRKLDHDWEVNDAEILEKLASDAEKLEILKTNLRNLRMKMVNDKKSQKGKNVNFQTVQEQLQQAEDSVVQLVDLNGQLVKNIESYPKDEMEETLRTWRIKVMQQAEKGSERIERLHLGIQKIQYTLLKMEDEKKNKGRNKFLRSRTIILRDFVDYGRKNSGKRKKGPRRWGCFRQSTSGNAKGS